MVILKQTENIYLTAKGYYTVHLKLWLRLYVIAVILMFSLYRA